MKNKILTLAAIVFTAGSIFISCQSSANKVENAEDKVKEAKDKVIEAQIDLNKSLQDSISEYQNFKKESEERINAHEKSIAEFKARIAIDKKENQAKYDKRLNELEKQNSDMKKMLDDYKAEGKDKWEAFKTRFNHNMDELGIALKNFTMATKK